MKDLREKQDKMRNRMLRSPKSERAYLRSSMKKISRLLSEVYTNDEIEILEAVLDKLSKRRKA